MTATATETHPPAPLAALAPFEFVLLTTYRANGAAVPTTVWFVYEGGKIFVTTRKDAGKIKRVRHNGRVALTPSDRVGNPLGEPQVTARGREAAGGERAGARAALAQKYGEMFSRIAGTDDSNQTYIVIEPA